MSLQDGIFQAPSLSKHLTDSSSLASATAAAAAALGSVTLFVGTGVAQAFASSGETKLEVKLGLDGLRLQIAE